MKRRLRFGVGLRGSLSGAELSVRILQGAALPPALFILLVSAYPPAMLHRGVAAVLFELGLSALPRWELLLLSLLYRLSGSEVLLAFALLVFALVFGLIAGRLLRSKRSAVTARKVYAALVLADLALRLLPFRFNLAFGLPFVIAGFLLRLGCLALVWLDLRAAKKARLPAASTAE